MRATDAGYYGPNGGRGRGQYSYEDVRESRSRTATRASGSYEYGSPRYQPVPRGVDVRIVDDEGAAPPPQRIRIRERPQPDLHIELERAPQPRIRYEERGGGGSYGDHEYETGGRGGRYEDDRYSAPREERVPYRPSRPMSIRERVELAADEQGPGVYPVDGRYFEAERAGNGWRVWEVDEPIPSRPPRRIDGGSGVSRADADRGPRGSSAPSEPSKTGGIGRLALRVAGWGLVGLGAFYAVSGVVGGVTNGMDWGPLFGRTAMNWQQAGPAIIGGAAVVATGGLLLRFTKKKPA